MYLKIIDRFKWTRHYLDQLNLDEVYYWYDCVSKLEEMDWKLKAEFWGKLLGGDSGGTPTVL